METDFNASSEEPQGPQQQDEQTPQEKIIELAQECFEETGVELLAVNLMQKRVLEDFPELMTAMVRSGCSVAVAQVICTERYRVWNKPTHDPRTQSRRIMAVAAGNAVMRLMDLLLPRGKRLGKANRAEVKEAADFYRPTANDICGKVEFYDLVASKMRDEKKLVEECLTEVQLQKFHSQFKGKVYV